MRRVLSRPANRNKSKPNKNQRPGTSFMTPMLEFLSRPGNYLANLQSSYASSGEGQAGAGGSNNLLSGATGLLTNNPLTGAVSGAVSGLIGDGSLSRKVMSQVK